MGCGSSSQQNGAAEKKQEQPPQQQQKQEEEPAAPAAEKKAAPQAAAPAAAGGKTKEETKALWAELRKLLPRSKSEEDKQRRKDLFDQFDPNGNRKLSLAEIDKGCREILELQKYTDDLAPILLRAYNAANALDKKDFVEFLEFRKLLCYIYDYFELMVMFEDIDTSHDRRVSRQEFDKAVNLVREWGLNLENPDATFDEIDADKGGMILFAEFAHWAVKAKLDIDGDVDNE